MDERSNSRIANLEKITAKVLRDISKLQGEVDELKSNRDIALLRVDVDKLTAKVLPLRKPDTIPRED